jgi:ribosomal protein S12 methylthiotransferase
LLDWLQESQLDRVGCFKYSPVDGAKANELDNPVSEEIKQERYDRFMEVQQAISTARLQKRIGSTMKVLIDEIDEEGAIGRTYADAPEIDGLVYLNDERSVTPGDVVTVKVTHSDEYDLWAELIR